MRDPYVYNDFTGNNPKTQESILKKKKKKKKPFIYNKQGLEKKKREVYMEQTLKKLKISIIFFLYLHVGKQQG